LYRLRDETGEKRLKIIASALNFEHCRQIVEAYRARNLRADYVHSKQDGAANAKIMKQLDNHDLDVIVQVRKLGEGFDHPYLSVAAVFSIFSNLSPFVQFVGRVMRVIVQNSPEDVLNQGVVVFHAGANIACQWADFQQYSSADQDYFDQLLPLEY
ncbi:DEAD/DEAH box helicase, partial [Pseudomonas sp. FSL R10-0071]